MSGSWLSLYPSLVLFEHLVLFLINILLFTDQKKKKKKTVFDISV